MPHSDSLQNDLRRQWLEKLKASLDAVSPTKQGALHIGIIGALGTGDVGDEAMLLSFIRELREINPEYKVSVFSVNPSLTENYTGIPCEPTAHAWHAPRKNPLATILVIADRVEEILTKSLPILRRQKEVNRGQWIARLIHLSVLRRARRLGKKMRDRGILAGRGSLQSHIRQISNLDALIFLGGGYINSWHVKANSYLYLLSAVVAFELGTPVMGTGMNLGPFNSFDLGRIAPILKRFSLIGLRDDRESVKALKFMDIYSPRKHSYSNDDAINLPATSDPELEKWTADVGPYISLHAHYWRLTPIQWLDFAAKLAKVVDALIADTGYSIVMLPMIFGPSSELFDARALRDIAEHCVNSTSMRMAPNNLGPEQLRYLYGKAASAIVCRHHSMVFSLAAGVPTTALYFDAYYRQKMVGVASSFGNLCTVVDAIASSADEIKHDVVRRLPAIISDNP
jgi:polysaccharide pyruvyl transferase WcaK-like protein